jgi:CheY-like chemotaxis protein
MRTVLYADDDPDDRLLMATACRKAGASFRLETTDTGGGAIGLLASREPDTFPSLVLLDLKMPDQNGFEVLQWIRANPATQALFVVLYSTSMMRADIARAEAAGASLFVAKPTALADLVALAAAVDHFVRTGDAARLSARAGRALR